MDKSFVVINEDVWHSILEKNEISTSEPEPEQTEELLLHRIANCLHDFPGYAEVHRVTSSTQHWTVENGLLTPTMKVKRPEIQKLYHTEIENMYAGH